MSQPGVLSHDELLVDAARNSPPAPLAAWLLPELRAMVAREAAGRHRVTHAGVTQSRALTSKVRTASVHLACCTACPLLYVLSLSWGGGAGGRRWLSAWRGRINAGGAERGRRGLHRVRRLPLLLPPGRAGVQVQPQSRRVLRARGAHLRVPADQAHAVLPLHAAAGALTQPYPCRGGRRRRRGEPTAHLALTGAMR